VTPAPAIVTLGNLAQTFDGSSKPATATTTPPGLTVIFTYDGQPTPPVNAGNYAVTATVNDPNFAGTASGTLLVQKATPVITWGNPADITYGMALGTDQLNATANVAGSFAYTPPAGKVLNAGNGQALSVVFTPNDTANYHSATANVQINVLKATPVVTWGNPADITYGTALGTGQFNATANVAGNFAYTPPTGVVLNAGSSQTLSVVFTPNDTVNYHSAAASVQINVLKATPVVTWVNPGDITYGMALGTDQLNATANVAGSFAYTPPAGTVLLSGNGHVLSATLYPTDATNYEMVTANVRLDVLSIAKPPSISRASVAPSGQFELAVAGEPGGKYVMEYSNDLIRWLPIATNTANATGNLEFLDALSTSVRHRFYRVQQLFP